MRVDRAEEAALASADGFGVVRPGYRIVRPGSGSVVVEIVGEYDLAVFDKIQDLFLRMVEGNSLVVVDVSEADFIDSSFLRALVNAHKHAEKVGSRFRLQVGTAPIVRRALEISGLTEYLDCTHDRKEALS